MKAQTMIWGWVMLAASTLCFAQGQIVLSNGEWAPYLSESLPHYGAASHIVQEAFSAKDIKTRYEFYPWKRSYKLAKDGEVNGTPVWVYTEERAKDFYYTDVVITDYEYLFHLKEKPLTWHRIEDLKGRIIGATLHTVYPTLEEGAAKGVLVIERGGNYDNLYHRLLNNRIDAIPQVNQVGQYYLRTTLSPEQRDRITYSPTVLQERKYHLILSKKIQENKKLLARFNQGLAAIIANGTYVKILKDLENGEYDKKK